LNENRSPTPDKAFVAKITAGLSHEFMNVLATIRETSGLMEDLLALNEDEFPHRQKFADSLASIRRQINRGMEIGEKLNRFAHSLDQPRERVEINDALRQFAALMQRFMEFQKAQLTVELEESHIEIETDPFRLQMVLAACLEYCLRHRADGGTVRLQAYRTDGGVAIRFLSPSDSSPPPIDGALLEEQAELQEALRSLGASLCLIRTPGKTGLDVILPSEITTPCVP